MEESALLGDSVAQVKRTGASPQGRGVSRAASLQLPVRRFSSLKKSNTLDERDVRAARPSNGLLHFSGLPP